LKKSLKIDLAILRLATYELTVQKSEPPKVVIDEAVELAKIIRQRQQCKIRQRRLGVHPKGGIMTLEELQKTIGVSFHDKELLTRAFVHRSHLNEAHDMHISNERFGIFG